MDVFSLRDRVIEDYGQFSRSFTHIKAPDLQSSVDGTYGKGVYWPSPFVFMSYQSSAEGAESSEGLRRHRRSLPSPFPPIDLAEMNRTWEGDQPPTARRWGEMALRRLGYCSKPPALTL
jgi:hypothetical protein